MQNATPRDTRAGFEIFLGLCRIVPLENLRYVPVDLLQRMQFGRFGYVNVENVNRWLERSGYRPVSKTTFEHYSKLVNAGYDRYISERRYEAGRAVQAYDSFSDLSRYKHQTARQGIKVAFEGSYGPALDGDLISGGEAGAIVEFSGPRFREKLSILNPQRGDAATLNYDNLRLGVGSKIVACDLTNSPAVVEFGHTRLVSLTDLNGLPPALTVPVRFTLVTDDYCSRADGCGRTPTASFLRAVRRTPCAGERGRQRF